MLPGVTAAVSIAEIAVWIGLVDRQDANNTNASNMMPVNLMGSF